MSVYDVVPLGKVSNTKLSLITYIPVSNESANCQVRDIVLWV